MYGIPVPRYALVNRQYPYQELEYFIEEEDYVEVHGHRFWKPFVEKPVHGEQDFYTNTYYLHPTKILIISLPAFNLYYFSTFWLKKLNNLYAKDTSMFLVLNTFF